MGDIEGMTVAFTGFGSTGVNDVAGDGSDDGSFGTPRQGENVIDAAVGGLVGFEFENPGLGGSEATTFPGDSGMGYLKEVNGEFQLLGVHSGITDADDLNEYGAISFGVNVQTYKDWIEAKGIPEPSTFVLLGLGGLGLIFHRSRLSARTRAA
jgi:hypothetical protein